VSYIAAASLFSCGISLPRALTLATKPKIFRTRCPAGAEQLSMLRSKRLVSLRNKPFLQPAFYQTPTPCPCVVTLTLV